MSDSTVDDRKHLPELMRRYVSPPGLSQTLRVNQLDMMQLDSEIHATVLRNLYGVFGLMQGQFLMKIQPELDALVKGIVYMKTVCVNQATPGGRLQNVRYVHASSKGNVPRDLSRRQRVLFIGLNVIFPWFVLRLRNVADRLEGRLHSANWHGSSIVRKLLECCERLLPRLITVHAVAAAVNFIAFLQFGFYATLADRLLGIRLMHVDVNAHRQKGFEFMNRVMLWHGLAEFLLVVMPLIDIAKIRAYLARKFLTREIVLNRDMQKLLYCGVCQNNPSMPMRTNCGHLFCYFCIASEHLERPDRFDCPSCGALVTSYGHVY